MSAGSSSRSFTAACCERITDRLLALVERSKAARTSNGRELVVIKDAAIKAFMKDQGIRLRTCSGYSPSTFDAAAQAAGRAAGDRATFGRPVTGAAGVLRIGRSCAGRDVADFMAGPSVGASNRRDKTISSARKCLRLCFGCLFLLTAGFGARGFVPLTRKRNEARDLLGPVYSGFTEGFDTCDLREAKALVHELAS